MATPTPHEGRLLAPAADVIDTVLGEELSLDHGARLDLLEAVAADAGGFELAAYRRFDPETHVLDTDQAVELAAPVAEALATVKIPTPLALTALARQRLSKSERRTAGAYYTDFRLAQYLASHTVRRLVPGDRVIDPAAGTGILLAAVALELGGNPEALNSFLTNSVHAADLSVAALRGVRLALASLTNDIDVISTLSNRLRATDSLVAGPEAWRDVAPDGFDLVIGNPPWEKLKVTRHEHLVAEGINRHYGAGYEGLDLSSLDESRAGMAAYAKEVAEIYESLQGGGEIDLYQMFLSLSIHLLAPSGQLAMLLPAGLIRSQGTTALRQHLLDEFAQIQLGMCFNHARFFAIDTRFKFVVLHSTLAEHDAKNCAITLDHLEGTESGINRSGRAIIERGEVRRLRPDLSLPEVRSQAEWNLFRRMSDRGAAPKVDLNRSTQIVREVDMTRDRELFEREAPADGLPLLEGRMVHQFRHEAKAYHSGSGRSAKWEICEIGTNELRPQFWISVASLGGKLRERAEAERVGFCDIAGQTNERSMLAARVPAGSVCGNKVPTIVFPDRATASIWLAVVNSFAFDWLLRRVLTTTVNYFLLRSVPLPSINPNSSDGRRLADLVERLENGYHGVVPTTASDIASCRAEVDALVLRSYDVTPSGADLILADFPLLDRGQPPIPGEAKSTVTRDLVSSEFARLLGTANPVAESRIAAATTAGAVAYIPAEAARAAERARRPRSPRLANVRAAWPGPGSRG